MIKVCCRCKDKTPKPITDFSINNTTRDRYSSHCKACEKEYRSRKVKKEKEAKVWVFGDKRECKICHELKKNTSDIFHGTSNKPISDPLIAKICSYCRANKFTKSAEVKEDKKDSIKVHSWELEPGTFNAVSQKYLTMSWQNGA